ncbi:hypothetical protein BKH42_04945 [Helicobacter sp. 13S00482-2]|uniref:hypothetical protein n=1 Tax=Helicobacter sp. 13S00482-2 TaxID=1476200 RepID=UPI000BDCC0DF|nr:hypothetical protein [Helicobacter sp. 13S00482-2]PAF53669.1 hypothetical protein BKH42_04945 [Helicobacter sp. 13S00482-2]
MFFWKSTSISFMPTSLFTHLIKNSLVFINDKSCKKGGEALIVDDEVSILEPILQSSSKPSQRCDGSLIATRGAVLEKVGY